MTKAKVFVILTALVLTTSLVLIYAVDSRAGTPSTGNTIYDADTNQLWNRLNKALFVRTAPDGRQFGLDELDILYWYRTTHLITGPSHDKAMAILNEFINTHGEQLIRDPLKRALLQRDLWELFDWLAKKNWKSEEIPARRELQSRLAVIMRRLALTTNEISALPDNYALTPTNDAPDLPADMFQTNGDWVSVSDKNDNLTAPTHVSSFDGHSTFQVLLHVPDGRQAAISYLDKLRRFEHVWIYVTNNSPFASTNEPREVLALNPKLPQFPTNTEWALVRRMCVIDTDGNIQPTPIIESIQMRRYYAFKPPTFEMVTNSNGVVSSTTIPPINFYEFVMNHRQNCELREIDREEKDINFVHFMSMGIDPFESSSGNASNAKHVPDSSKIKSVTLHTCIQCHYRRGIFSVNSYTRFLSFTGFSESPQRPANLTPTDFNREIRNTIDWKQRQFDWGLLQGLEWQKH